MAPQGVAPYLAPPGRGPAEADSGADNSLRIFCNSDAEFSQHMPRELNNVVMSPSNSGSDP